MNIFAAIKKAINSNLNKPLDLTLDEIKYLITKTSTPKRVVATAIGVPYNSSDTSQVLSLDDNPIISVNGSGRIIQIIPVVNSNISEALYGTALISVDGEVKHNTRVQYCNRSTASTVGTYILDYTDNHKVTTVTSEMFGEIYRFNASEIYVATDDSADFKNVNYTLVAPNGFPFRNGFDIRLTHSKSSANGETYGVIVVYELCE